MKLNELPSFCIKTNHWWRKIRIKIEDEEILNTYIFVIANTQHYSSLVHNEEHNKIAWVMHVQIREKPRTKKVEDKIKWRLIMYMIKVN